MPAGYSKRSLPQKLGIKPGARVVALHAPPTYASLLGELPEGAAVLSRLPTTAEFIHYFVLGRGELAADFPRLSRALADAGVLWVSWPKKTSRRTTDLDENIIRTLGLAQGLVDVKVCAVDDVWSGLKFVRRLENRSR